MRYKEIIKHTSQTSPDVMESESLTELAGVKRFQDMTTDDILAYYRNKLGDGPVKLMGDGQHGAAVQIGQNIFKMWLKDSAYTDFVTYALKHQGNPFLPRFLSGIKTMPAFFRRSSKAPDVISYVKMEKLSPLNKNYVFHLNMSGPDSDVFSTLTLSQFLSSMTSTFDSIEPSFDVFVERLSEEMDHAFTHQNIPNDIKLLVKTIIEIMNVNPAAEHTLDLHLGNFMMRGEQLVLLDPIHNWTDTDINDDFYDWNANWGPHSGMGKRGVTSKHVQRKRDELQDDDWPQDPDEEDM